MIELYGDLALYLRKANKKKESNIAPGVPPAAIIDDGLKQSLELLKLTCNPWLREQNIRRIKAEGRAG